MDPRETTPISLLAATALMLNGCATPTAYTPVIQSPPPDMAAFERDFSACASEVAAQEGVWEGQWKYEEESSSIGSVPADPFGYGAGVIVILAVAGMAYEAGHVKKETERAIQARMTACLQGHGYSVSSWKPVKGGEAASVRLSTPTTAKLKFHGWIFPGDGTKAVELEERFATLQACQLADVEALKKAGATAGGYACALGCRWIEGSRKFQCSNTWTSDRRTQSLFEATQAEAAAAREPRASKDNLSLAAKARREAEKAGSPAPVPAAPPVTIERKRGSPYIALQMPPYKPAPGASGLSSVRQRTFKVETARDARPGPQLGSRIGALTAYWHMSFGDVETTPPPDQLLQEVLAAELSAAGHRPSADNPDIRIVPELRRFELSTPVAVLYWYVNVALDVNVNLQKAQQPARTRGYSANCSGRSMWTPDADLMTKVVADCLKQIGSQFRQDAAVGEFIQPTEPGPPKGAPPNAAGGVSGGS